MVGFNALWVLPYPLRECGESHARPKGFIFLELRARRGRQIPMATLARGTPPATQILLLGDAQELHLRPSSLPLVIILPVMLFVQH